MNRCPVDEKPAQGDVFVCNECGMSFAILKECCCDDANPDCMPSFDCCGQAMVKAA